MDTFKNKLKKLFNDPKYNLEEIKDKDADRHFIKLIYEQQRKIRNNSKNKNFSKNKSNSNIYYQNDNNIINMKKSNFKTFSRNKSLNNINKKFYSPLFSVQKISNEKTINNITTLMRSFTLKDIHSSFENNINLSRSYSQLDINETEKSKNGLIKKITYMKRRIGLDDEKNHYNTNKLRFNIPQRSLNYNLYNFEQKEYYLISPSSRLHNSKKKYINYPFEIKGNNKKFDTEKIIDKIYNKKSKGINNDNKKTRKLNKFNYINFPL